MDTNQKITILNIYQIQVNIMDTNIYAFAKENIPIFIFIIICYLLSQQSSQHLNSYLVTFVLGFIFTHQLNLILKNTIKEPRPKECPTEILNKESNYGMPSGHGQYLGFEIGFIANHRFRNPDISSYMLILIAFMSTISMYTRYINKIHSAEQLLAGFSIGLITGYFTWYMTKQYVINYSIKS